jgi:RNA polymerase sigma factor (sigma-70 family)
LTHSSAQFEGAVLAHLDAAYSLARWLVKDEHCAQDLVHDAYMKAMRYFGSFRGGDARPWILGIVRNTCYTWLGDQKRMRQTLEFREDWEVDAQGLEWASTLDGPEQSLIKKNERELLNACIEALPEVFREALVLREIEDLSYEDIARITAVPIGTVMSRLSRARGLLRHALGGSSQKLKIIEDSP